MVINQLLGVVQKYNGDDLSLTGFRGLVKYFHSELDNWSLVSLVVDL